MSNQRNLWLRTTQYLRALGTSGQLLTLLGLLPTAIDILFPLLGLYPFIPAWLAIIWFVGVYGYANFRIFEAREQVAHNPKLPLDYDVIPLWFQIQLSQDISRIEIAFRVINFLSKDLTFKSLRVSQFYLSGNPTLEDIPARTEVHLPPRQTELVMCSRVLIDSEARTLARNQQMKSSAGLTVKGEAIVRNKMIEYSAPNLNMLGWIEGNPNPPQH